MGPYHAIMVHFPVALWTVASGIIIYRALSDGALARALDRVLVPFLVLGVATGAMAYVLGQLVWSPETLQKTPLGRNHMMGATWTLSYWAAVLFLRWWAGERAWEDGIHRVIMVVLGALGAGLLMITGTLGGHLHGAPAYLSEILRMLGWDVYTTFYVPNGMLLVLGLVIVVMPALAHVVARSQPGEARPPEQRP